MVSVLYLYTSQSLALRSLLVVSVRILTMERKPLEEAQGVGPHVLVKKGGGGTLVPKSGFGSVQVDR